MTTRRSSSLLLLVLLASALFIPISSLMIPTQTQAASLTVTLGPPASGKSGDIIIVLAQTVDPAIPYGTSCTVTSTSGLISSYTAVVTDALPGPSKSVVGSFKVGNIAAPAGGLPYDVVVKCTGGGVVDSGSAAFTLDPSITLTPSIGIQGSTITVTGVGFRTDATCTSMTAPTVISPATAICSITGGSMTGQFVVANVLDVIETVTVAPTAGASATASFQKVTFATIVVSPSSVPQGFGTLDGAVTVSGAAFSSGTTRSCTITSSTLGLVADSPAPTCSISSTGSVTGTFAVSKTATVGGPYTITVTDSNPAGAFADFVTFAVANAPSVLTTNPVSGPPGTPVTLVFTAANPFAVEDVGACTITSAPTGLISAPACFIDTTGNLFVGAFAVASNPAGQTYVVTVTGIHGDSAITSFTVSAGITLNPTSGSPPVGGSPGAPATEVTVTGAGFSTADTSCTITAAPVTPGSGVLNIDTTGEPPCVVSAGVLTAKFRVGAGSTFDIVDTPQYTITVTGTPASDPATALFDVKPQIVVSPNYGPAGIAVVVSGSGFDSGLVCTFVSSPAGLDNPAAVCTLNADGTAAATFTVSALPGVLNQNYTITITGGAPIVFASAGFSRTGAMNLFPTSGHPGTNVLISGTGFNPLDTGCSIISYPSNLISNPLCTVAGGSLSGSFTVAAGAAGSYTVKVVGTTGDFGLATFTVSSVATLILNPIQGEVGTVVSATGSDYQGTTCLLTATPSGLFTSQSCSIVAGTLTGSFAVALGAAAGTLYTVTVETNAGAGDSATATFAVTSGPTGTLSLTPTSGPPGTVVSGTAAGFPTDTTCMLTSSPSGLLYLPNCILSGGSAVVGFTVSSSAPTGTYTLLVVGNTGRSASATFTIGTTPSFSLSVNPSSLVLSPGGTGTVTVTVLSVGTFSSPVTLVTTMPTGVTGGFSPNPVTPPAGSSITSILNIGVSSATPSTTTTIEITATSGTMTAYSSVSLVIQVFVSTTATSTSTTLSTTTAPWQAPPCIIATVTFGSEVSPAVQFLRSFRDGLVLSTQAGSAFMEVFNTWYYSFSPTVAKFIASNDPLRAPVRVMLYPLLGILSISTLAYSIFSATPELGIAMAGLVASSLIGLVYFTAPALLGMHALLRRRRLNAMHLAKVSLASLAIALALLTIGEVAGSFLLLAIASSAVVLTCVIAVPVLVSMALLRPSPK